jgi:hypothetical protein
MRWQQLVAKAVETRGNVVAREVGRGEVDVVVGNKENRENRENRASDVMIERLP